jgi:hypothetical protein
MTLAHSYGVDPQAAFMSTMRELDEVLDEE